MDTVALTLTTKEIRILSQALNEVCNGIHLDDRDFATRMGAEREEVITLLKKISNAYDELQ